MSKQNDVIVLGIFVADLAFYAPRMPVIGETLAGSNFVSGPGGKGGNQAVASARAGASTGFITRLGKDAFGDTGLKTWAAEGVTPFADITEDDPTGAAFIFVNDETGENAVIVVPGAAGGIDGAMVERYADEIAGAKVFVTQLEQPVGAALRGLEIARAASVITVFNPAPAEAFSDAIFPLCDYITPNETEAEDLTGIKVDNLADARRAGDALLAKGVGTALLTLGETGALFHSRDVSELIPAAKIDKVVDTTGAGDAFNGCFAAALARGEPPLRAAHFANIGAGISVTRAGTAPAMATYGEIIAKLKADAS